MLGFKNKLWLDTETFSEVDIKKAGGFRYAEDESTEILLYPYAINDGPEKLWDVTTGKAMPSELEDHLLDDRVLKIAHNFTFDHAINNHALGIYIPWESCFCTMASAYLHSLPGSLDALCKFFGLSDDKAKMAAGKKLIQKFCKPQPANRKIRRFTSENAPDDWEVFCQYAKQDVGSMREVASRMPMYNWSPAEYALWQLDMRINERGAPVDVAAVDNALEVIAQARKDLSKKVQVLTNGVLDSTGSRAQVMNYFTDQIGFPLKGYTKADIKETLADPELPELGRKLLEIRQQEGMSSVAKYDAFTNARCSDNTVKGTLQYCGAQRTARWAGRIVQLQNVKKTSHGCEGQLVDDMALGPDFVKMMYGDDLMGVASSALRGMVCAPDGFQICDADLSNIEGRVLPWLAGEESKLDAFRAFDRREGPDLYRVAAAGIYCCHIDAVDGKRRQVGKTAELACGYEGGVGAFIAMAKTMGIDLEAPYEGLVESSDDDELSRCDFDINFFKQNNPEAYGEFGHKACVTASLTKIKWRNAYPNIVKFWSECANAFANAVENPGNVYSAGKLIKMRADGDKILRVRLPSGRYLCYWHPRVKHTMQGNRKRRSLSFMGSNQVTRQWERIPTYSGKIAENLVQAVARDVLAFSMPLAEKAGYKIFSLVHDEELTLTPKDPRWSGEKLAEIMAINPPWATGLPLAAAGWTGPRYKKD